MYQDPTCIRTQGRLEGRVPLTTVFLGGEEEAVPSPTPHSASAHPHSQAEKGKERKAMQPHASVSTATYTTIPISPADVIARSLQNLSSSFSLLLRPTSQFLPLSLTAFDRPSSFSCAKSRLFKNASYFRLNYALVLSSSALLSLLHAPLSLLLISALCLLWCLLYLCREDPIFLCGRQLTDRTLLIALSLLSFVLIFGISGVFWNLLIGLAAGAAICALHAILRNGEGLALDEWEAASEGLISSAAAAPPPPPQTVDRIRTATVVRF